METDIIMNKETAQYDVYVAAKRALGIEPSIINFPTEQECIDDPHSCIFAVKMQTQHESGAVR